MDDRGAEGLVAETVVLYSKVRSAIRRANLDAGFTPEDYAAEIAGGLLAGGHVQLLSPNVGYSYDELELKIDAAVQLLGAVLSSLGNSTHMDRHAASLVRGLLPSGQVDLG